MVSEKVQEKERNSKFWIIKFLFLSPVETENTSLN